MKISSAQRIPPKEIIRVDHVKKVDKLIDSIERKDWNSGVFSSYIIILIFIVVIVAVLNSSLPAIPVLRMLLIVSTWILLWRMKGLVLVFVKYVVFLLIGKRVIAPVVRGILNFSGWIKYLAKAVPRFAISKLRAICFKRDVDIMEREFFLSPRNFSFLGWNPCYEAYQALEELKAVDVLRIALKDKVHVDLAAKGLLLYESDNPETLELIANANTELASNAAFLLASAE